MEAVTKNFLKKGVLHLWIKHLKGMSEMSLKGIQFLVALVLQLY